VHDDVSEEGEGLATSPARAPFTVFSLAAAGQLVALLVAFWLLAPKVFWAEFSQPWLILLWTFLLGVPVSLFEYLYHRYLLHSAVLPFLSSMKVAHVTHHGLTNVRAPVKAIEPEKFATVTSGYPIVEEHQEESMMFPLWSGLVFAAVFEVLLAVPLKLAFPSQPLVAAMIFTVMLYYSWYEVWHALLHLPFDTFWKPKMGNRVVRRMYAFHLMHHWRPTSNIAIVGFWGVAVWDHLFRTHRRPENMPLDRAQVTYLDSKLDKPRWPISVFDKMQGPWARTARSFEQFLARVFLGRAAKK
jgi:hypothetical protein